MSKHRPTNSGKPRPKKPLPPQLARNQFKPGQSGNPNGRPPLNPIQRALRELTVDSYRKVIEAVCTGNMDNLKQIIEDPKSSVLEVGIARSVVVAVKEGDYETLDRIAARVVGKIPDELNVNAINRNANMNATVDMSMLKAALESLKDSV